jgi:hypothetical protein
MALPLTPENDTDTHVAALEELAALVRALIAASGTSGVLPKSSLGVLLAALRDIDGVTSVGEEASRTEREQLTNEEYSSKFGREQKHP